MTWLPKLTSSKFLSLTHQSLPNPNNRLAKWMKFLETFVTTTSLSNWEKMSKLLASKKIPSYSSTLQNCYHCKDFYRNRPVRFKNVEVEEAAEVAGDAEAAVSVAEGEDLEDEEEAAVVLETAEAAADLETAEAVVDLVETAAVAETVSGAVVEEAAVAVEDGGDLQKMYIKLMAKVKYTLFCYRMNEFFIQDVRLGVEHLQLVDKHFESTSKLTVFVLS